jgi:hypothetical protein
MKKQLLWGMLLLMAGFSSCRKDSFKPVNDESSTSKNTKVNVVQPTYTYADLILQPRQPGENFDTYKGIWSGQEVKVIGTPSWYQAGYPTLVDGAPAFGASYGVYNNANFITSYTVGAQDFFTLSIGAISLPNITALRSDLDSYSNAIDIWVAKSSVDADFYPNNPYPNPYDYIKNSYTDQMGHFVNVTGKLIRVTTGSHWALASIDYPSPKPLPPPAPQIIGGVPDPNDPTLYYVLSGTGNAITSVKTVKNGVDYPMTGVSATGSYTHTNGTFIYHVTVTIHRSNGTTFSFTGDLDIS